MDFPYIRHVTDTALTVVFGNEITPQINARVCAFAGAVEDMKIKGVTAVTPTYRAVMVEYCPLETSFAELRDTLAPLARGINPARTAVGKRVEIPVCYGGEYGPDLAALAAGLGLSQNEVIKIHSYVVYPVYMMGFSPGFPYLGGMDSAIAYPRLEVPRTAIPAGSVGIAGGQTGVYPIASPGGWQLIGRTPLKLFDMDRESPFLLSSGDTVRFVPISEGEFKELCHD